MRLWADRAGGGEKVSQQALFKASLREDRLPRIEIERVRQSPKHKALEEGGRYRGSTSNKTPSSVVNCVS